MLNKNEDSEQSSVNNHLIVYQDQISLHSQLLLHYLTILGIDFEQKTAEDLPIISSVPLMSFGKKYYQGFSPKNKEEVNNWLNKMGINVTIDKKQIFKKILEAIFGEDNENFRKMLQIFPEMKNHIDSYGIVHYLFQSYWEQGIQIYIELGGNINLLTEDKTFSLQSAPLSIIGGQSILHILASSGNKDEYEGWKKKVKESPDLNGNFPLDLGDKTKQQKENLTNYKKVKQRSAFKFDKLKPINSNIEQIGDDIFTFEITDELTKCLSKTILELQSKSCKCKSNSMHNYSLSLNNSPIWKELLPIIKTGLQKFNDVIVSDISTFHIQYSEGFDQKLDTHTDDSIITINICLENNATGTELVFDDLNLEYKNQKNKVIFHRGNVRHHVLPLVKGERSNIIIWVR
jgi:hypothetical protein